MSDVFAEATVKISPILTDFKKDLETDLKTIMDKVKVPPVRVKPALSRDFIGDLTTQVNAAVARAQARIKPIRIKAFIEPVGIARGTAGALTRGGGGAAGAAGGGGGGGGRRGGGGVSGANQALQRSLEHVTDAQRGLNAAFDETLSIQDQVAAVTKVTTSLNDAQASAERSLTKAIVAKDSAARKAAQKQLADIEDFRRNIASRVTQVQAQVPTPAAAPTAGTKAAIASTRKLADSLKSLVVDLNATDAAYSKLTTSGDDLAKQKELLRKRTQILTTVSNLEQKSLTNDNVLVKQAIANAKLRATAAVDASNQQVEAIEKVVKAEKEAARQAERLERTTAAARQKAARAAASQAAGERRRSEQLSRGGQASLLSLAGIRGATLAASRSFLVGAAAITVFARAVKQFADLERNLHVFAATTSATASQMELVREEATALGADLTLPAVSAGDAAGAMVELAKAGLTVQDSIDGARAVLELATAAAIDNAEAVRLVANVLNAFNLAGKDAADIADTLANAANAAQGSIADIGTAFQQAASAGHQVGLSFQDTATFLTILAKNGIRGSDAGTSLRTALIRLVNPSEKAKQAFKDLGIVLRDAAGNLRPDVFLQIAAATSALEPAQRDATIALIGGQDAFRAVTILGRQSVDSFLKMRAALREEGTAAELAKARTEGLHGAMDGLQSILETVGTNLARHVGPGLAGFVHEISAGITALSENEQTARVLNQTLDATSQAFHALGAAISGVSVVALPLASALASIATSIGVSTILAGVVAYKALNAVLGGLVLRLGLLAPLFKVIAAARIGSNIASGVTAASLALGAFNQAAGVKANEAVKGFSRLTQVQLEMATRTAASTRSVSALSVALRGMAGALFGPQAVVAVFAAIAAGAIYTATKASILEKAISNLAKANRDLASSYNELKAANQGQAASQRGVEQQTLSVQQAVLNHIRAVQALKDSDAPRGSIERRQLLLNEKIAAQDVTFATQDFNKAQKDLKTTTEEQAAARDAQVAAIGKQKKALKDLLAAAVIEGKQIDFLNEEQGARIALSKAVAGLAKVSKKNIESGDAELKSLGRRQLALRGFILAAEKFNRKGALKPIILDIITRAPNVAQAIKDVVRTMKFGSEQARREFIKGIINMSGLGPAMRRVLIKELLSTKKAAGDAAEDLGGHLGKRTVEGFEANFDVSDIVANALAHGLSLSETLVQVQKEQREAQAKFNKIDRATKGGTVFKDDAQQEEFEDARDALNEANEEVKRLTDDIKNAADEQEQAIKDAANTRNEQGQKIADAVLEGRRATLLQRKITSAGLTDWLGDDLKANQDWLEFLRKQKEALRDRLKKLGVGTAVIKAVMTLISNLIFETTNTIKRINNDIADNVASLNEVASQKIDLRIRIAQARDDVAAEIRARTQKLRLITAALARLKNAGKKNTVAWLELKAQQAEEIAAINALRKQTNDGEDAARKLQQQQFEFLQTIQGFGFNLISNLIPGGATGGLVGGTSGGGGSSATGGGGGGGGGLLFPVDGDRTPPLVGGRGRQAEKALATAGAAGPKGFTSGQGNRTNQLLKQILAELHKMNRSTDHPEARHQRKTGSAAMDYGTGGGGGGHSPLAL